MRDDRVLIDTAVWIEYFRGKDDRIAGRVEEVLTDAEVFVPRVVIAELIQGAKSEKEISVIEEFVGAFNIIDQTEETWLKAGRLSYSMKRKGLTMHLVDCYIAVLANENDCLIFSLDEHFKDIGKFIKLDLLM